MIAIFHNNYVKITISTAISVHQFGWGMVVTSSVSTPYNNTVLAITPHAVFLTRKDSYTYYMIFSYDYFVWYERWKI